MIKVIKGEGCCVGFDIEKVEGVVEGGCDGVCGV